MKSRKCQVCFGSKIFWQSTQKSVSFAALNSDWQTFMFAGFSYCKYKIIISENDRSCIKISLRFYSSL